VSEPSSGNLWILLEAVAKRRGLVYGIVLTATIIAIAVTFILPKWYEANALLLPPKDSSSTIDQLSKLSEMVSVTGGLNLPVMVTASDIYAKILQSRTVTDRIVERFKLADRYDTHTQQDTYLALLSHCDFRVTAEGLVSIRVEDKDPKMAADMANAFSEEINKVNQEIVSSRARHNRIFVEERLSQVKRELDSSRKAIEGFQQENKAVDFDEQTRLAIEQASSLKVDLAKIDLELQISEQTLGKDNPELVEKRQRRSILEKQLSTLETGGATSSYFSMPVSQIPTLKGKYELLYSKVKVSESLYNMLLDQLERAKIQEKEESPSITVLDEARVPEVRSRPKRTLITGAAFVLSLFAALLLVALLEYMDRMRRNNPKEYDRVQYVLGSFFGWLPGVKRANR
jgi:tyrosine-protein kinase Etk/Wzc